MTPLPRMSSRAYGPMIGCALACGLWLGSSPAADKPAEMKFASFEASKAEYDRVVAPFFAKHCTSCHGPKKKEGELAVDLLEPDMKATTSAARWAMLLEKLATREMPPETRPRPDDESVLGVTQWIAAEMKRAEAQAKYEQQKAAEPEKFKNKMPPKVGKSVFVAYNLTDFPDVQPVELPATQRAGILTQPSWLVANSVTDDNHAIHRGKWVRERLLGGVVPDIPITVDAQLPIDPKKTLRERMSVTQQEYCWKCHQFMNRVGLPFEIYDHYGRYRTEELGKPVDAKGGVEHVGVASIEGDVTSAVEMLKKLATTEQVERVFVRHAFRFWMGRNETLGDAATLQAAHAAYKKSGGSMKALIVSLVTSDSFLMRVKQK